MLWCVEQEENGRQLFEIVRALCPNDLGNISRFFEVRASWCCPSCLRTKPQIARLDRNGNLLCAIVSHHDHWGDFVHKRIVEQDEETPLRGVASGHLSRFEPVLICNDCNVVEPAAKRAAGAPEYFSFSPAEIGQFIIVCENGPHDLIAEEAVAAYESAKPQMVRLRKSLTDAANSTFQHIGVPLAQVMSRARYMKDAAE